MISKSLLALALAVLAGTTSASAPMNDFDPTLCPPATNTSPKGQSHLAKPAGPPKVIARAVNSSPRKTGGSPSGLPTSTVKPRPKAHLAKLRQPTSTTLAATPVRAPTHACPELGRGALYNASPDGALATLLAGRSDDPAPAPGNGGWGNSDANDSAIINQNTEPRPVMNPIASQFHGGSEPLNRNTFAASTLLPADQGDSPETDPRLEPLRNIPVPELDLRPLLRPTIGSPLPEYPVDPRAPLPPSYENVPEPATLMLLAIGCAAMGWSRRRKRG